jgi:hypothetical protein
VATATNAASLGGLLPSLLAADLGLMCLYLLTLTAASRWPPLLRAFPLSQQGAEEGLQKGTGDDTKAGAAVAAAESDTLQSSDGLSSVRAAPPLHRSWVLTIALAAAVACQLCSALEQRLRLPGSGTIALCLASAGGGRAIWRHLPSFGPLLRLLEPPALFLCCVFLGGMGASARAGQVIAAGPAAATFGAVVLVVHCLVVLTGVRLLNLGAQSPALSIVPTLHLPNHAGTHTRGYAGTDTHVAGR